MSNREELPAIEELEIARVFDGVPTPPPLFIDGKPNVQAVFAWYSQINTAMDAGEAFASLGCLLMAIDRISGDTALGRSHYGHRQAIFDFLRTHRGLRALARNWFLRYRDHLHSDPDLETLPNDSTFLIDLAAILSLLFEEYPAAFPADDQEAITAQLRGVLRVTVDRAMAQLRPQIEALVNALLNVVDLIAGLSATRSVLLELPIGNSIPSKLLIQLLNDRRLSPEVVRISLPRNTSLKKGITRQELIEQRLAEMKLGNSDLVVLVDEWVSGANFRGVTESLRKICNKIGARFLPVALLTVDSSNQPKFDSHCGHHDKIAAQLGVSGQTLRAEIPAAVSLVEREGYFFWGEYDRISGYRKVQVLGSWIRQIDRALDYLSNDEARIEKLQHTVLAQIAKHAESGEVSELSASRMGNRAGFHALFNEAYEDYQGCREDLCSLDHPSNRGEVEDLGEDSADVMELVSNAVADRPAAIAVALASMFIESEHIIDTDDPFPLAAHVPVVVELEGGVAEFHDRVMESLYVAARDRRPPPEACSD